MRRMTVCAALLVSLIAVSCADPLAFREGGPQGWGTIFSPLDAPAGNDVRTAAGAPGPAYWQQRVDYEIDVSLDDEAHRVRGVERVTYHNNSPHTLPFIWIHLEQNVFAEGSKASAIQRRSDFNPGDEFEGGCEIESVRAGGRDAEFEVFGGVGRLVPAEPIEPGGVFEFEIAWSFNVPLDFGPRMGAETLEQGVVYELAQWFPAVAVYDDVHGWNTMEYIGSGEFYTNFGDYTVRITAPRDHLVVATGTLQNPGEVLTPEQVERLSEARGATDGKVVIRGEDEVGDPASRPSGDGPLTWEFTAEDVRTFAWASSEAFIWDAGATASGVLLHSAYPKEGLPLWGENIDMMRYSVDYYSEQWFPYPYPQMTNVNGIEGGMEYPMIVFCGARRSKIGLWGVTDHEIGHTWFPMVVNTDERRHAWMDEGFNTFINYYSFLNWTSTLPDGDDGDERLSAGIERRRERFKPSNITRWMALDRQQPLDTPPDMMVGGRGGLLSYRRPGWALVVLREYVLGEERFDYAFREYIRRWAFKSPRPWDFFRTMEDASGENLSWFWRGWFLETGELDIAVDGVHQIGDGEVTVRFSNRGELVLPVVYEVRYADGTSEVRRHPVEAWYATNRATAAWSPGKRVVRVEVDPAGILPDADPFNDWWPRY